MVKIEETEELFEKTDNLINDVFSDTNKMRNFLQTLSKMYKTSYNNILLLKSQREDISFVAEKSELEKLGYNVKDGEMPLQYIKGIRTSDHKLNFKTIEVFDISQTDAIKEKAKTFDKEYVETMLKGMCSRRGLYYNKDDLMQNIENIVSDISSNTRQAPKSKYNVDRYATQSTIEIQATTFAVAKALNINTRNYNLKDICKWGVENDNDINSIRESLKYIQKFTNYFIRDYGTQERLNQIDNTKNKEEQEEFE